MQKEKMQKAKMPNAKKANKNKKPKGKPSSQMVVAPNAIGRQLKSTDPRISSLPQGAIRITHREMMWPFNSDAAFNNTRFFINPGMKSTFPWLSLIAPNYETYRFEKLNFVYEPSCSTSKNGTVFIVVDYDALDMNPESFQEAMAMQGAVSGPLWSSIKCVCSKQNLQKWPQHYTRRGVHAVPDLKTYDVGSVYIGNDGGDVVAPAGYLYAEYTVTLFTPQLNRYEELDADSKRIYSNVNGTLNDPLGDPVTVTGGLNAAVINNETLRFYDPGEYLIDLQVNGTGLTGGAPTLTGLTSLRGIANAAGTIATYLLTARITKPYTDVKVQGLPGTTWASSLMRIAPYLSSLV